MNGIFGFTISKKLDEALDRTFKKFEEMSSKEIIALGRKHSGGDIATFLSSSEDFESTRVQELTFAFNSPVVRLKSFVSSFEQRSILHSDNSHCQNDTKARNDIYEICASLGAFSLASFGNTCQAA